MKWWQERVVYQIYPRSFQDSNGDGIGDIPGIISRLDELAELGVGVIWLSPVYLSPDADNGYDIADYRSIDPKYGTMADMEALIAGAARRDIRIIMDLVINHTSDEHEWFQKSRDQGSEYRDYYIWRPGKGPGNGKKSVLPNNAKGSKLPNNAKKSKPPNNWTSLFMGSAWEFDGRSGEYYLHLFARKQPDLNYHNPRVVEEVKGILRFWLDKGVAGFRCDVINAIYKTSLADSKGGAGLLKGMEYYKTQEGCHKILQELRRDVLDHYDCFTVGETLMATLQEAKDLCDAGRKELDMIFYFSHLEVDRVIARYIPKKFRARKLLEAYTQWQQGLEWNALYLENHDQPRIVSHFGDDGEYRERSAKLLAVLEFSLRGTPFIYQGQEIGMTNFDFSGFDQLNDVETLNLNRTLAGFGLPERLRWKWLRQSSRDNARTPMQWSAGAGAGFTTGEPWLGINGNHGRINYEAQRQDPASILSFYKGLIKLRAGSALLREGAFEPRYADNRVMVYDRVLGAERLTVALNFSARTVKAPGLPSVPAVPDGTGGTDGTDGAEILISNTDRTAITETLLPWEAVMIRRRPAA
jgi:oligo-1,6-glucosidase